METFRGRLCHDGYAADFAASQQRTTSTIDGHEYPRVRYGDERGDWAGIADRMPACGDCMVERGELHLNNCDIEQCPRCGGQSISCACHDINGDFRRSA